MLKIRLKNRTAADDRAQATVDVNQTRAHTMVSGCS